MRPLKMHAARHTFASLALQAGKSVRWVADQLGHADPALTLRTYAHAMREEESDLGFLDFGALLGGTKRHPGGTSERASGVTQQKAHAGAGVFREQPRAVAIPVEV